MIDFHCHLDLYPNPHQVVRDCIDRKMHVLSVTTTPSAWEGTLALAKNAPTIRTALGLHPQLAQQRKGELSLFEHLLPEARYIGEIGLDGSPEFKGHWADQQFVFTRILQMCRDVGGRAMSIHSRRAANEVLDVLKTHKDAGVPILHWFSGTSDELKRAIDLGCWFSVGPAMLNNKKGKTLAASLPRDRVVTESDGPFAQIDRRTIFPWDAIHAVELLADIWIESSSITESRLANNFRRLTAQYL